jgi:polyisoprenoid-binding protein YceI
MKIRALTLVLLGISVAANAIPVTYVIDPDHTHPAFETDHLGGLSKWRGVFKRTAGTITLDAEARTGTVDIVVDVASIDLGHDKLNDTAANSAAPPIFESATYPSAHYTGTLARFRHGAPTRVDGQLTLHGVTRPLTLTIESFKCIKEHPLLKGETCGADASATLDRSDFGITVGKKYGYMMDVTLRIQVEALKANITPVLPAARDGSGSR